MLEQHEAENGIETLKRRMAALERQIRLLKKENEYLSYCLNETRNSFTYRLGRILTYLPRWLIARKNKSLQKSAERIEEEGGVYEVKITEDGFMVITHQTEMGAPEYGEVQLQNVFWGGKITIPMEVPDQAKERILWIHNMSDSEFEMTGEFHAKGPASGVLCLYTGLSDRELYLILFSTMEQVYSRFVHFKQRWAKAVLRRNYLLLRFDGVLYTAKTRDIKLENAEVVVDDNHRYPLEWKLDNSPAVLRRVKKKILLKSIVAQETQINNPLHIEAVVQGVTISFNIGRKRKRKRPTKFYYVPSSSKVYGDSVLFIRKNVHQNFTLVVRKIEKCETERLFRILESRPISSLLYHIGKLSRNFHRKKVNLYFEKNAEKAEEGAYCLFQRAVVREDSRNYFILDRHSELWKNMRSQKNVVGKYTMKYYWLLFSSDYLISTETSSHLNVHRARNRYVRTALLERPLIFLQHGVTYLKRQGVGSVFGKGKEGEPLYMVVGSKKEQKIVCKMLKLKPEQCICTGLPVFSTIPYGHINAASEDIITVMFTWRPSEEHMGQHFEDSSYYKKICQVKELLKGVIPDKQLRIVPHPKVLPLLKETSLQGQIWERSVAEVLHDTKLLITDYSSVCYNAFYQGAAVVFYQPDLEAYEKEVGKLIPKEDEYIGERALDAGKLEQILISGIQKERVRLDILRTEEYSRRYSEINEFNDGKNIERIYDFLVEKKIV